MEQNLPSIFNTIVAAPPPPPQKSTLNHIIKIYFVIAL